MVRQALMGGIFACVSALSVAHAQDAAPIGDEANGEAIFTTECRVCHGGLIAPNLRGVAGRSIASIESFGGYSEGLKAKRGERWTDQNLSLFLASPSAFAPGTGMSKSLPEAQPRADIIAFLKTLPPPR